MPDRIAGKVDIPAGDPRTHVLLRVGGFEASLTREQAKALGATLLHLAARDPHPKGPYFIEHVPAGPEHNQN